MTMTTRQPSIIGNHFRRRTFSDSSSARLATASSADAQTADAGSKRATACSWTLLGSQTSYSTHLCTAAAPGERLALEAAAADDKLHEAARRADRGAQVDPRMRENEASHHQTRLKQSQSQADSSSDHSQQAIGQLAIPQLDACKQVTTSELRALIERNFVNTLIGVYILLSLALLIALAAPKLLGADDGYELENEALEALVTAAEVVAAKTALPSLAAQISHDSSPQNASNAALLSLWTLPVRGHCQRMRFSFCAHHNSHAMPYERTLFPNQLSQMRADEIETFLRAFEPVVDIRCYSLLPLFLCSLYAPKCEPVDASLAQALRFEARARIAADAMSGFARGLDGRLRNISVHLEPRSAPEVGAQSAGKLRASVTTPAPTSDAWVRLVPPCRALCKKAYIKCTFFFEVLALDMMDERQCDGLPDTSCVGERELASEAAEPMQPQNCPDDEIRCNSGECIPQKWRCDGFFDCSDQSDERACSKCDSTSHFHCGNNHCIQKRLVCDGTKNCADGRDERECVRLAPLASVDGGESINKTRIVGQGRLDVWLAERDYWQPVCGGDWRQTPMSNEACRLLGYSRATRTLIAGKRANLGAGGWRTGEQAFQEEAAKGEVEDGFEKQQDRQQHLSAARNLSSLLERVSKASSPLEATKRAAIASRQESNCETEVRLKCEQFECGKPAAGVPSARLVVGGTESLPGEFPYIAALHGGPDEVFFCGGVVISSQWLVTAAHCVGNRTQADGWTVRAGMTRRRAAQAHAIRKLKVKRIVKHPQFNNSLYHNDIALVQLAESVEFNAYLRPICVPPASLNLDDATSESSTRKANKASAGLVRDCAVVGFGKAEFSAEARYVQAAHSARVPIVRRSVCEDWYSQHNVPITDTMLCAGYAEGARDACQGDSGSGLFCLHTSSARFFLAGVVSFGIKCASAKLPGIYTAVPPFADWIQAETGGAALWLPPASTGDST